MVTEAKPSLIGGLATLTAQLDSLCTDQDPEELSKALGSAFTERELYKMHLSFLAEDKERVKVLLEVFDKVCTSNKCHSAGSFSLSPSDTGPYSPTKRHIVVQEVPPTLWSSGIATSFTHYTWESHKND